MARQLSVLCVHGISHGDIDPDLEGSWSETICDGLVAWNPDLQDAITCDFLKYDDLLEQTPLPLAAIKNKTLFSFGSQIGNSCVRDTCAGRIAPLTETTKWLHLYNPEDHVFTADICLSADNFEEVGMRFKNGSEVMCDH